VSLALKARAYDLLRLIHGAQQELQQVEQEIFRLEQEQPAEQLSELP
jgi:hypothetical protein